MTTSFLLSYERSAIGSPYQNAVLYRISLRHNWHNG